jgi:hypothetical protein
MGAISEITMTECLRGTASPSRDGLPVALGTYASEAGRCSRAVTATTPCSAAWLLILDQTTAPPIQDVQKARERFVLLVFRSRALFRSNRDE